MVTAKEWLEAGDLPDYPWVKDCVNLAGPRRWNLEIHGVAGFPSPTIHDPVVCSRPENIWVHPTARIDSFVKLEGGEGLWIGPYVHIASFGHINAGGGQTLLEEGVTTASHVVVVSGRSDYGPGKCPSAAHPDFTKTTFRLVIREHTVVFAGAIVYGSLPPRSAVSAGSVVSRRPPFSDHPRLIAGSPATHRRFL